jgi:hypothetical protein
MDLNYAILLGVIALFQTPHYSVLFSWITSSNTESNHIAYMLRLDSPSLTEVRVHMQ